MKQAKTHAKKNKGRSMSKRKRKINKVKPNDAFHYMMVGYLDYIAARFLLNNDFMEQGITLSSTAVEKYIKCVLAIKGVANPVHLYLLDELEELLKKENISLLDDLDRTYLNLLGHIYQFRYYDKIEPGTSYGFFKWQVIGELDATINLIESKVTIINQNEPDFKSPYANAKEAKDEHLWLNNFALNGIDKKTFMEKKGMFCMSLTKNRDVLTMTDKNMKVVEYNGRIAVITSIETPSN